MVRFLNTSVENADVEEVMSSLNDYILLNKKYNISFSNLNYSVSASLNKLFNDISKTEETDRLLTRNPILCSEKITDRIKCFIKKVIRKLIRWYVEDISFQQSEHNENITRSLKDCANLIKCLKEENNDLRWQLECISDNLKETKPNIDIDMNMKKAQDTFYVDFENTFRGSTDVIKDRLKFYLPYVMEKNKVIDIGCGRGEFLELMRENNIDAIGVDINSKMVEMCQDRGLNAILGDGIKFLNNRDDESIEAIFASQLVEHLSMEQLNELIDISMKKLSSGGYLILETVNPLTLGVFCYSFYMDPTHVKPVHPATLRFILERKGFDVKPIQFLDYFTDDYKLEIYESMNKVDKENIERLNETIFGAQDYAIICEKK